MISTIQPVYLENGNLRMYHMNPYRRYVGELGIDDMIAYLPEVLTLRTDPCLIAKIH